jgi:hypothetical protein
MSENMLLGLKVVPAPVRKVRQVGVNTAFKKSD